MNFTHSAFFIILILIVPSIHAQQPYIKKSITTCETRNDSTSELGYFCNGVNRSCQSYLTFRSITPYNTVSTISALLGANPSELSQLNSVSRDATFQTDTLVIVPVTCSCSGQFYQANVSYAVRTGDSFFDIANYTLQGLSTCQAIDVENTDPTRRLIPGTALNVPLRCACPTKTQTDDGVNYLLSYLVATGQFVSAISETFGVDTAKTLSANGLSEQDPNIYPFTTLLLPLQNPPVISQIRAPPPPPPQQPPPTPTVPSDNSSSKTWVFVVVAVVVVLGLIIGVVFWVFIRNKKKKAKSDLPTFVSESFESVEKPLYKGLDENSEEFLSSISSIAQSLEVYKFEELKSATDNFNPSCLIEGSVYRGVINGDLAAIKRMNGDVSKEITLLSKINHFNLIRLSGVCFSDGHWYLVYEYAANGSLSDWISKKATDTKSLTWTQRIQIALDVATGLDYLHSYASPPHVHKDLRSSNIMIDSDIRAKIANFGLASSAGEEGHFVLTRHIVGAKGYMAPEYLENGLVSPKLDVYSFGVLLLEILSGKEVDRLYEGVQGGLLEILIPLLQEEGSNEKLISLMDPKLQGNYPAELSIMLIKLSERCLDEDLSRRPSMGEIVQSLSKTMSTTLLWESSLGVSGYRSLE